MRFIQCAIAVFTLFNIHTYANLVPPTKIADLAHRTSNSEAASGGCSDEDVNWCTSICLPNVGVCTDANNVYVKT